MRGKQCLRIVAIVFMVAYGCFGVASATAEPSWIRLQNVQELRVQFEGPTELASVLQSGRAVPLSLASADLDEDGVPLGRMTIK